MKRSRFVPTNGSSRSEEEQTGQATANVCRQRGVCSATFEKRGATYGGTDVSKARQLIVLEDANARLKRLLADAKLENAVLNEVAAGAGEACQFFSFSERRALRHSESGSVVVRYGQQANVDSDLWSRLRKIAFEPRRFGYRRRE